MAFIKKEEVAPEIKAMKLAKLSEKVLDDIILDTKYSAILRNANSPDAEIRGPAREKISSIIKSLIHELKKSPELEISFKFEEKELLKDIQDNIWGFSKVTSLVDDDDITDVRVTGPDNILYKKDNVEYKSDLKFSSAEELRRFVRNICVRNRVNLSDVAAQKLFSDKESSSKFKLRIAISGDLVMCNNLPYIHIRKHPKVKRSWQVLEKNGVITHQQREFLSDVMKRKDSLIIGGAPGSRKTTLLNALIEELPQYVFGECYQETDELNSDTHPGIAFKNVILPSVDSMVSYSLEDYAIHGLTSGTEVMIISEVKGHESQYVLKAIYTGVATYLTIHALSAEEVLENLVTYIMIATGFPIQQVKRMLLGFKYVAYMEDVKVYSILKVTGLDKDNNFMYEKITFKGVA